MLLQIHNEYQQSLQNVNNTVGGHPILIFIIIGVIAFLLGFIVVRRVYKKK